MNDGENTSAPPEDSMLPKISSGSANMISYDVAESAHVEIHASTDAPVEIHASTDAPVGLCTLFGNPSSSTRAADESKTEQNASTAVGAAASTHISKRQQRKLARLERNKERYAQKKVEEKLKKQQSSQERRAAWERKLAELDPEQQKAVLEERAQLKMQRKQTQVESKQKLIHALSYLAKIHVCIDMEFTCLLSDGERKSLFQQIGHSYHAVVQNVNQDDGVGCKLHAVGMDARFRELFNKQMSGCDRWQMEFSEEMVSTRFRPEQIVYLTHDALDVLETLEPEKVYVIGGIVDRNRLKGITYEKAQKNGWKSARLNVDRYVDNPKKMHTLVLTVNHMVEILVNAANGVKWKDAYKKVIPSRKMLFHDDEGEGENRDHSDGSECHDLGDTGQE